MTHASEREIPRARMVTAIALFGLALVCTVAFGAALAQQGAFTRLAATYASLQGGMR